MPTGDTWESAVPALAIEHGLLECAYPARAESAVPPLYPLVAAGILAVSRAGNGPLPVTWEVAVSCDKRGGHGSVHASEWPFLLTGLVGWPVLAVGSILVLGAGGLRRTRWELFALGLIACLPFVAGALLPFFHPEDLLAMGFILATLGVAARDRWGAAGICIGLACCSKQYALLALIPLAVVAPREKRVRFTAGCVVTAAIVVVPLLAAVGRGMARSLLGSYATTQSQGTLVATLHLHGAPLTLVSRVLPLVVAACVAGAARIRLGRTLLRPAPLSALVVTCLALRLVFEVSLISYYFLATAVGIVVVDALSFRLRGWTIGWLLAVAAFYPPDFELLVPARERAPVLFQLGLMGWLLALSVSTLWRARSTMPVDHMGARPTAQLLAPGASPPVPVR
jgi:hypothetical protein